MDTRKLIKFGKNSFVVSIPKEWVAAHKLVKGAVLNVEQKPGSVTFSTGRVDLEERSARISCDNKPLDAILTEVTSLYQTGCSTLTIEGTELSKHASEVKKLVHNLAGAEIVEQSLHKMVVKDLIDIQQVKMDALINRIDMMIRSMFQDALSEEYVSEELLRDRDQDVNRLQLLVRKVGRLVIEKPAVGNTLGITPLAADYMNKVAWTQERIGDYLKRLNGDIIRSSPGTQARLRKRLKYAYDHYLAAMKSYYQGDFDKSVLCHAETMKRIAAYTKHVHAAKSRDEVLALENIKNILRDIRIILRATIETAGRNRSEKS
ncbi:hypothetical protein GOV07_02745 [Candidatus Woesearchaeota archaeon]|nr:hypothetical protein [Candidatus Woesearchaeota archaeon]